MIPKIIHYCWLSGEPFPENVGHCISSWKKHLQDYEFVLWDTKKFDINSVPYVKEAFDAKKYAFASDYIRLYALYYYGGIYLDSDIEVFKSFDSLLDNRAFTGFEDGKNIAAWILASEKENPIFKELLSYYSDKRFRFANGSYNLTPNVVPITNKLIERGLLCNNTEQNLGEIKIYPRDYFCPMIPYSDIENCYTQNTICQHLFNGAWIDEEHRSILNKKHVLEKKYGRIAGKIYYAIEILKVDGIEAVIHQAFPS